MTKHSNNYLYSFIILFVILSFFTLPNKILAAPNWTNILSTLPLKPNSTDSGYTSFSPPTAGNYYTDPVFGTKIWRLTDCQSEGKSIAGTNIYPYKHPFSADSNKIYVHVQGNGDIHKIFNTSDATLYKVLSLPHLSGDFALFDPIDTTKMWYFNGNVLYSTDISKSTPVETIEHTFSGYSNLVLEDISQSGDLFLFDGNSKIVTWRKSTNTTSYINQSIHSSYNECTITKETGSTPRVLVLWDSGSYVYDWNLTNGTYLGKANAPHHDGGNGEWYFEQWSLVIPFNRDCIYKASFNNPTSQTIVACFTSDGNHAMSMHVSNDANNGWFVTDNYTGYEDMMPSSSYWYAFTNEIVLARISDGATWRLAHHRTRYNYGGGGAPTYWQQPHAVLSPNGKYVVYKSTFNNRGYTDAYLLEIPTDPSTSQPSPPTGLVITKP